MTAAGDFGSEAEMVAAWLGYYQNPPSFVSGHKWPWTVYAETAGWDLLLVHNDGFQVGLEAKLSLNAKVLDQALSDSHSYWRTEGPDYRGVLVPRGKVQHHIGRIATALGLGIVTVERRDDRSWRSDGLPDERTSYRDWPNWCPAERCKLPDYVPDVCGGKPAPVALTPWKIGAIKLMVLLDRRGFVTRSDMKALQISPTRWTDSWHGFLERTPQGFVRCDRTPDLKAQHPVNYAQIESDVAKWWPHPIGPEPGLFAAQGMPLREDPKGLRPKAGSPVAEGHAPDAPATD